MPFKMGIKNVQRQEWGNYRAIRKDNREDKRSLIIIMTYNNFNLIYLSSIFKYD